MQNQNKLTWGELSVILSKIPFNSSSLNGGDILFKAFKIMEEDWLMQKIVKKMGGIVAL